MTRADLCKHLSCDVHTHIDKHEDVHLRSAFNLKSFSAFQEFFFRKTGKEIQKGAIKKQKYI